MYVCVCVCVHVCACVCVYVRVYVIECVCGRERERGAGERESVCVCVRARARTRVRVRACVYLCDQYMQIQLIITCNISPKTRLERCCKQMKHTPFLSSIGNDNETMMIFFSLSLSMMLQYVFLPPPTDAVLFRYGQSMR